MDKIKVVHLINEANLGGGARAVRTFCRYAPDELELHVVTRLRKGVKYDDFSRQCQYLSSADGSREYVEQYLNENKIHILHLHGRGVFSEQEKELVHRVKPKVKIVYTNIFGEFESETDELIDLYLFKSMHALTQKFAPRAGVEISEASSFYRRYRVIPNPVDVDHFESIRPSNEEIANYKAELGIKGDEFVIGKIGARKAVEKWSDLLLYMFPKLLSRHPNLIMLIQGLPDSRKGWVKKFGDRVKLLPSTNNDRELALMYNVLDVFTHVSKIGEQSGNSINEAMFWAKPVVVNLTPKRDNGQLEQVRDGETGFFANTPTEYASRVSQLLGDMHLCQKMGEVACNYVITHNSAQRLVYDLFLSYQMLIGEKAGEALSVNKEEIVSYDQSYQERLKISEQGGWLGRLKYYTYFFLPVARWKVQDYIEHNYHAGK